MFEHTDQKQAMLDALDLVNQQACSLIADLNYSEETLVRFILGTRADLDRPEVCAAVSMAWLIDTLQQTAFDLRHLQESLGQRGKLITLVSDRAGKGVQP